MQQQRLQRLRRIVTGDDNSLRRCVDKLESAIVSSLVVVFLVAGPVLAIVAIQTVGSAATREQRAESTWRQVPATLTQSAAAGLVGLDGEWDASWVTATWRAPDGAHKNGMLPVELNATAGQRVMVWVTQTGRLTHQPLTTAAVIDREVVAAIAVPAALAVLLSITAWAVKAAANRRRIVGWTKAWETIGPRWSSLR